MTNLIIIALSLGAFHAFIGPDHYVPFVALAKIRNWNFLKTLFITLFCGIGHVLSSVLIGFVGIFLGISLGMLNTVEAVRGDMAAYMLFIFGIFYIILGTKNAFAGNIKTHTHAGELAHSHDHSDESKQNLIQKATGFWTIFLIFVFGPCEVLIPLVMTPAIDFNWWGVFIVSLVFSAATIAVMVVMVSLLYWGATSLNFDPKFFRRWGQVISGACITACASLMLLGA